MASNPGDGRQAGHARRHARPRPSTHGTLDVGDDPLSQLQQQQQPQQEMDQAGVATVASDTTSSSSAGTPPPTVNVVEREQKDFAFLLRPDIFQAPSLGDLPAAFRSDSLQLETEDPAELAAQGRFRRAANVAANGLKKCKPNDYATIFDLYYLRLASLQLLGLHYQAAQESRALQDFNGALYRDTSTGQHLAPWELRLLIIRLQAIGFNDWRRGIMAYYELGREARFRIRRADAKQKAIWQQRLSDLGVRVGNALVELGDLDAAARHLEQLSSGQHLDAISLSRLVLIHLRMGNVAAARIALESAEGGSTDSLLEPLCKMAEGDYEAAVQSWISAAEATQDDVIRSVMMQNLAVCHVYTGDMEKARQLLEQETRDGKFEPTVTFNLVTIYELSSERARELKVVLAEKAASAGGSSSGWEKSNLDFKL